MPDPIAAYIDFEEPQSNLAAEARFGLVRFRKRPPDTTCQHPSVDFSKPEKRHGQVMVSCVCLGCGVGWRSCKVIEPKGAVK